MKKIDYKLKLLYVYKILLEQTDEFKSITMSEILDFLKKYDIEAERKSVYDDIEILRKFGVDIVGERIKRKFYYAIVNRDFEVAELRLLVDAVQSSKFITEKKSNMLIKKLESLTSVNLADKLHNQVYVAGRLKACNEEIYYNIDKLHRAISGDLQIEFKYCKWNIEKKLEQKYNGKIYRLSPWALIWENENYYLLAFSEECKMMRYYRVDKIVDLKILSQMRLGSEEFLKCNLATHAKEVFAMYTGEKVNVKMRFANDMIGVVLDRFGNDINIVKGDSKHFIITVPIEVSNKFLSWVISMNDKAEVLLPLSVRDKLQKLGEDIAKRYK